jgi:hypothetical protein
MRRLTQGLLVTAVITVAGASGFLIHQASSGEASGAEGTQRPNAAASAAPIEVRTVMATVPQAGTVANAESRTAPNPGAGITGTPETAGPAVLEPGATATGTLEARRQAVLAFPVGGVVTPPTAPASGAARPWRGSTPCPSKPRSINSPRAATFSAPGSNGARRSTAPRP